MKLLFTTLCIFLIINSFSQSIVKNNKIWSVIESPSEGNEDYLIFMKFGGDTVFNGLHYKTAYKTDYRNTKKWNTQGYYREENNKIYQYYGGSSIETLIYDFNLEVGDTIEVHSLVFIVDSINYSWNKNNNFKQWHLSWRDYPGSYYNVWIEKIGSLQGVLFPKPGIVGATYDLVCVTDDNEVIYQNSDYSYCESYTTSSKIIESNARYIDVISCDNGALLINSVNENNGNITFFSLDGKQIIKQAINQSETQICLPQSGLMIYRFTNENGEVQTGKVMVK